MKNKFLIISSLVVVSALLSVGIIRAEDYCGQAYQLCLQARELGAYAESQGIYTGGLSGYNCNEIIAECSGQSSYSGSDVEDYYETKQDYTPPTNQTTTPTDEPTAEEKKAAAQAQAVEDWLDYLNLSSGDFIVNQPIDEDWVKSYYRPTYEEDELGLTGRAQTMHNQLAQATQAWLDAIDNGLDRGTIRALQDLIKDANFDYREALVNVLEVNPRDSTANHELAQQFFNDGTVDSSVVARQLESRAFVNLDALERQTLDARAKEEAERNGFAKAFYNPKPEESTFLTTMQNEIGNQFSYVKDESVDWLKQTDAYVRAETYSEEVRGFFRGFSSDIFHVDNTIINQAAYGQ
ncbi:MAG: hypothetical protein WC702_04805 [Patescibacteria group bacterium]|jgi:hypothetical protein